MNEELKDDGLEVTDDSREPSTVNSLSSTEETSTETANPTSNITTSEIKTMEVHHHPHVEKKSFKEYLLEGLMIFIAVSMGFIAENIREHISDTQKERELIVSLIEDLQVDQKAFTETINYLDKRNLMIDSFVNLTNTEIPIKNTRDFYYWGKTIIRYSPVIVNTSTIDEIKFGSNFRLIRNKHLTKKILEYYNFLPYIKEYETRLSQSDWDFRRVFGEVVDPTVLPKMMGVKIKLHKLDYDPPLRNQTKDNLSKIAYYGHSMLLIRGAVQDIINQMQLKGIDLLELIQKEYHIENE